jgi:hypothetical protein
VIVLDTNVLSALMQRRPPVVVIDWVDRQPTMSLWTTTVTVFEIEYGLKRMARGKRRRGLEAAFRAMLAEDLDGRVLSFDVPAALAAGEISVAREKEGRPVEVRDVMIAGIARSRRATVATRNIGHFDGSCPVVDPWAGA